MARVRVPPLSIALICIILTAIFAPVTVSMIGRGGDYVMHMQYALLWEQDGLWGKPLPHFFYQSLLIFFKGLLPGQNFPLAAAVVNTFSYLSLGLTLYVLSYRFLADLRPRPRLLIAVLLTVIFMLVAPVNLLTWSSQNLYFGYIGMQNYHNPTVILLKPMALWLFLFALKVFQGKKSAVPMVLLCAAIAAISTVTKPNYALCLLPALAICTLYVMYRRQPVDWRLLLVGIVVPVVVVIIWQGFFYRYQSIGGFGIAPFQVINAYTTPGTWLPKLILSMLFPAFVLVLYFKQAVQNLALRVAWLAFAMGVIFLYVFVETREWQSGNFTWGAVVSLFILFVVSTFFLIQQYKLTRQWTPRLLICAVVLLLHLLSGIAFYIPHLSDAWNVWY